VRSIIIELMLYTLKQKTFLVESYFRNGTKVDDVWTYSETVSRCIKVFRETGSVTRKKGSRRPLKRTDETINSVEEIMENKPRTSILRKDI
ncbi:hypothetical protein BDFB_015144, partial [Asbolus verrucosus]